jgi:hypothetical protein
VALSRRYRVAQNVKRAELLQKLIAGDRNFVKLLLANNLDTEDNKTILALDFGRYHDPDNMHRKNLRGIRTKKQKVSASEIAWRMEVALDGAYLQIKGVSEKECGAFLRFNTLLYALLEMYA